MYYIVVILRIIAYVYALITFNTDIELHIYINRSNHHGNLAFSSSNIGVA